MSTCDLNDWKDLEQADGNIDSNDWRTWDKQMATYSMQPDGLLKEAGGYIYM